MSITVQSEWHHPSKVNVGILPTRFLSRRLGMKFIRLAALMQQSAASGFAGDRFIIAQRGEGIGNLTTDGLDIDCNLHARIKQLEGDMAHEEAEKHVRKGHTYHKG